MSEDDNEIATEVPAAGDEKLPHETWAERKGVLRDWRYNAARAGSRWIVGFEVTESEFDKAVADAATVTLR